MRQSLAFQLVVSALLLTLLAGCAPKIVLDVPAANIVASVEVSNGYSEKQEHVLRDPKPILEALDLVRRNNSGWSLPLDTFPTPKAQATFKDSNNAVVFVLWFGPDWVGARSFNGKNDGNYMWAVGADVRQQLQRILGVGA